MNEQQNFERIVAESVSGLGPLKPSEGAVQRIIERADRKRQRPEWLALIKEPPMRTNSRITAGSPTVRVAAIAAATLLLAVALAAVGVAGQRLLAAGPIVVAQDGSGTYTTINAAIEAAVDGDRIEVRPGTYVTNVEIVGKDLEIAGDGSREDIVIEVAPDEPPSGFALSTFTEVGSDDPPDPRAIIFADTRTELSNVTVLADPESEAISIVGPEADVSITGVTVQALGDIRGSTRAVSWEAGASGSLRESHIEGWVWLGQDTTVMLEDNEMPAACVVVWEEGADVVIRDNVIHGCEFEKGLEIDVANDVLVEGNDIWVEDVVPGPPNPLWGGREGIAVFGSGSGTVTIRDNDIHDSLVGIEDHSEGPVTVEIRGNRITENELGLRIGFGAAPAFVDNVLCGNEQLFVLAIGMDEGDLLATNEVCEADPAA